MKFIPLRLVKLQCPNLNFSPRCDSILTGLLRKKFCAIMNESLTTEIGRQAYDVITRKVYCEQIKDHYIFTMIYSIII